MSSQDLERFRTWQLTRSSKPFSVWLQASPETLGLSQQEPLEDVRVVAIQIGKREGSGRQVKLSHILLSHPGVGYIRQHGELIRDAVLPQSYRDFDPPVGFDVEQLRHRFLGPTATLHQFEGYPLQSEWQLTFEASPAYPENWNLGRAASIRFAVQYSGEDPFDLEDRLVERANLAHLDNLPPQLTRYEAVWRNTTTSVRGRIDGTPVNLKIPLSNAVDLPLSVAALAVRPPPARRGCTSDKAADATSMKPMPPASPSPQLIRTCASDADIRRYLYLEKQRSLGPRVSGAAVRSAVAVEFSKLKSGVCAKAQVIPTTEPVA